MVATISATTPGGQSILCHAYAITPDVVHGVMHGTTEIQCDAPVVSYELQTNLYRNGSIVAGSASGCKGGFACGDDATYTCHSPFGYHVWHDSLIGTVVFPPGYEPPRITVGEVSPSINLYC